MKLKRKIVQIGLVGIAVALTAQGVAIDQSAIDFKAFLSQHVLLP